MKSNVFEKIKSMSLVLVLVLICLIFYGFQKANPLEGDPDAIALTNKMLRSIGGEKIWREAQSIKVEMVGYSAQEQGPWDETFWIDLDRAYGRFIIKSKTKDEIIAWTPKSGWHMSNGVVEAQDSARHNLEMEYWKRQSVVVFHRLASGIPRTKVVMGESDFKFDVIDAETDQFIAQFTINKLGEPVRWSTKIGDRDMGHVFGPLKKFKNVTLPEWGATSSGMWRYLHTSISLSKSPPPVSYDPPSGN